MVVVEKVVVDFDASAAFLRVVEVIVVVASNADMSDVFASCLRWW